MNEMSSTSSSSRSTRLERVLSLIPASAVWLTFFIFFVFSFVRPVWVASLVIIFDVYWLVKAIHVSLHLISAYKHLSRNARVNWNDRLERLKDVKEYLASIQLQKRLLNSNQRSDVKQQQKLLFEETERIEKLFKAGITKRNWEEMYHLIILPTYKEEFSILDDSIGAITKMTYPLKRVMFVLATEERDRDNAQKNASLLQKKYGHLFFQFFVTRHPQGLPGESLVKGANVTFALRRAKEFIDERGIPYFNIIASVFDADTQPGPEYFSCLTYYYLTNPKPTRSSYQPIPMYDNNLWETPALMRVVAVGTSFWYMIESSRPERLCTFSSHSMSFQALVDVDFYPVDVVSDDSRIFYRCFLHYRGDYHVQPMFVTVSMDALARKTFIKTIMNQYKQIRRWAWGIENFPYVLSRFLKKSRIPLRKRIALTYRIFEGNYTWATTAIIISFAAWLPLLFGGLEFEKTVLSQNFLLVAQILTSAALFGLIVSIIVSLLLLPKQQASAKRWYITALQWFLIPITTIIFGSLPAIDAQTRLMLGRRMEFSVTEKTRKKDNPARSAI